MQIWEEATLIQENFNKFMFSFCYSSVVDLPFILGNEGQSVLPSPNGGMQAVEKSGFFCSFIQGHMEVWILELAGSVLCQTSILLGNPPATGYSGDVGLLELDILHAELDVLNFLGC